MTEKPLTRQDIRRVWESLERSTVIDTALIGAVSAVLETWIDAHGTPVTLAEAMRGLERAFADHQGRLKRF